MAKGIDYGLGQSNVDHTTDIRYGVISPHSVSGDALQDVYSNGTNLTHAAAVSEVRERISAALEPIMEDIGVLHYVGKHSPRAEDQKKRADDLEAIVDAVWDSIEQDWNDQYTEDEDTYRYTEDGYILETSSLGVFVTKSPFFTYTRFCSPCAPGAGDLDSPDPDGVKTYCLGRDWFEDETAPYPVFSVETGAEV